MDRDAFEVEFVTPCFLGGSGGDAEWRAASIRGQLRWWFRAVAGSVYKGDLGAVRNAEEQLFGSTERDSLVRIRTLESPTPVGANGQSLGEERRSRELAALWREPAAAYRLRLKGKDFSRPLHYLGYGPIDKGGVKRGYLPPRGKASFELQWQRPIDKTQARRFDQSLWAWIHLGGIGARSRKGFGSLRLLSTTRRSFPAAPVTRKEFIAQVRQMLPLSSEGPDPPEWTHFSRRSRVYIGTETFSFGMEAMERLGAWLIAFRRRYGYPQDRRKIGDLPLANRDYAWAAPEGRDPRGGFPDRAGFGLPLPFQRKITRPDGSKEAKGENIVWGSPDGDTRRASPLLLHVARVGDGFLPVMTYLPARFLPENGRLYFQKRSDKPAEPTPEQLNVVDRFLDDLAAKKLIEQVMP